MTRRGALVTTSWGLLLAASRLLNASGPWSTRVSILTARLTAAAPAAFCTFTNGNGRRPVGLRAGQPSGRRARDWADEEPSRRGPRGGPSRTSLATRTSSKSRGKRSAVKRPTRCARFTAPSRSPRSRRRSARSFPRRVPQARKCRRRNEKRPVRPREPTGRHLNAIVTAISVGVARIELATSTV
jgi:hypothetical protein